MDLVENGLDPPGDRAKVVEITLLGALRQGPEEGPAAVDEVRTSEEGLVKEWNRGLYLHIW